MNRSWITTEMEPNKPEEADMDDDSMDSVAFVRPTLPNRGLRTELSTQHLHFIEVMRDRCTARYVGTGNHSNDVGAVQATNPFDPDCMIGYFEITVEQSGHRGQVAIGASDANFRGTSHPGVEPNSFGFHAEDGKRYHGSARGESYSVQWGVSDTVGCGIIYHKHEIFFTKNGKFLGIAFTRVPTDTYYPTLSMHSPGEVVKANFGARPFMFDLQAMVEEERSNQLAAASKLPCSIADVSSLVQEYLFHSGYAETLSALLADQPEIEGKQKDASAASATDPLLHHRNNIRRLILAGKIEEAISVIDVQFPNAFVQDPHARFLLDIQAFIELVRENKLDEAVLFSQEHLARWRDTPKTELLGDAIALLAYDTSSESPLAYLLGQQQREQVADAVNTSILQSQGQSKYSKLERVLRQLLTTHNAIRDRNGGKGEPFDMSWFD